MLTAHQNKKKVIIIFYGLFASYFSALLRSVSEGRPNRKKLRAVDLDEMWSEHKSKVLFRCLLGVPAKAEYTAGHCREQ